MALCQRQMEDVMSMISGKELEKIVREKSFLRARIREREQEGFQEVQYDLLIFVPRGDLGAEELWLMSGTTRDPEFMEGLQDPVKIWSGLGPGTLAGFLQTWLRKQHHMSGRERAAPAVIYYSAHSNAVDVKVAPWADPIFMLLCRLQGYLCAGLKKGSTTSELSVFKRSSALVESTARQREWGVSSRFHLPHRRD